MLIKERLAHLKPREKLQKQGPSKLADEELLCLILGSGLKGATVDVLAKKVYKLFTSNSQVTLTNLQNIKGIGLAKATQLLAIFELHKRMANWQDQSIQLSSAKSVYHNYRHLFTQTHSEELHIIMLNTQLEPIADEMIFRGSLDSITLHAREIFYTAIKHCAHSIIIIHNHPSQSAKPSEEDILFTKQMIHIGDIIGIPVLDHMIFTKNEYWSYAEE